jgi:hypothetical protein
MKIKSVVRHHPFSHQPGICCPLPGSHISIKLFPARLSFFRAETLLFSLDLEIQGPVLDFTVQLDLEQMQIKCFGHTRKGYLRYTLKKEAENLLLTCEKLPEGKLTCYSGCQVLQLVVGQAVSLYTDPAYCGNVAERLSLGMHKKQEWERVVSRLDLKEIFPIWMRLGQSTPSVESAVKEEGTLRLLEKCRSLVQMREKQQIGSAFETLFLASFEGILTPRLYDSNYQGILPREEVAQSASALLLLTQGASLIRSLFFQEEEKILKLLPCLLPDFHAGRCVEMRTAAGERLDFEWTKKQMRRLIFYPVQEKELHFKFSKEFKRCRVRASLKEKGHLHTLKEGSLSIEVTKKSPLLIDCFQK